MKQLNGQIYHVPKLLIISRKKGYKVSVSVVDQLLEKHHFRPRQAFKVEAGKKNIPYRDEQFKNIGQIETRLH